MEVVVLQLVCLLVLFTSMTTLSVVPVVLVKRKSTLSFGGQVDMCISFGNCIAGGIFLGMCFLGLFPYVNDKFKELLTVANLTTTFPLSQFVIIIGFFFIFSVENLVIYMRSKMEKECIIGEDLVHMSRITNKKQFDDESYAMLLEDEGQEQEVTVANHKNKHSHCDVSFAVNKSTGLRRFILLVALSVHSLFEGIMLGLQTDEVKLLHLFLAVLIHELLVAFAVGVNIAKLKIGLLNSLKYILIVTGSIPTGIVIGMVVTTAPGLAGVTVSAVLQGLTAGIFIHITFMEIIPEEMAGGKFCFFKITFLFIGFILMAILNFVLGTH